MALKRFILFRCDYYYPSGGWNDFVGSFDTLEEANNIALKNFKSNNEWFHIIDLNTLTEVRSG